MTAQAIPSPRRRRPPRFLRPYVKGGLAARGIAPSNAGLTRTGIISARSPTERARTPGTRTALTLVVWKAPAGPGRRTLSGGLTRPIARRRPGRSPHSAAARRSGIHGEVPRATWRPSALTRSLAPRPRRENPSASLPRAATSSWNPHRLTPSLVFVAWEDLSMRNSPSMIRTSS